MEEKPTLANQLLRLLGLHPREARAGADHAIENASGVKLRERREVEVAGDAGGHAAEIAGIMPYGGGGLRQGKGEAMAASNEVRAGGDEYGEPLPVAEGAVGDIGRQGRGLRGAGGREAEAGGEIGDEGAGAVQLALAVAKVAAGGVEEAGGLALGGEGLMAVLVGGEDAAAGAAHAVARVRVHDHAPSSAARTDRHGRYARRERENIQKGCLFN